MWIPSILRARGVNSSEAPGLRIEGETELCLPPPPCSPQGGWKVMKPGRQGLVAVGRPCVYVCVFLLRFFSQTGEGIPGPVLLVTSSDHMSNYTAGCTHTHTHKQAMLSCTYISFIERCYIFSHAGDITAGTELQLIGEKYMFMIQRINLRFLWSAKSGIQCNQSLCRGDKYHRNA